MPENAKQTIIESGTELDGTLRSDCDVTLSGRVKGQLTAPALNVTQTGSIQGQVKVTRLKTEGEIAGEIDAETVTLSGKVNDQTVIRAKALEVSLAQPQGGMQVTFGNCDLHVGDAKARMQEKTRASGTSGSDTRKDTPTPTPKTPEPEPTRK